MSENRNFDDFQVISGLPEAHLLKELQRESQNRRYGCDGFIFSIKISSIMITNHSVSSLQSESAIWTC